MKTLFNIFGIVCFLLTGCGPSAEQITATAEMARAQTQTAAPTLTPTFTPTFTITPSPTKTLTPTITATWTPNVTPTQLPEITPPAADRGNLAGLVLWNEQPVAQAAVWLCKDWDYSKGCVGRQSTNTDKNGYYVFKNIIPGKYLVAMNSFNTSWFIFYFNEYNTREQFVVAGQTRVLNPWNIWKFDLRIIAPENGKILGEAKPTLRWESYPGAAYYMLNLYYFDSKNNIYWIEQDKIIKDTQYQPISPMYSCKYYWRVTAFNEHGSPISQTKEPVYEIDQIFYLIDLPTSCD